ncbi:hypothetical protein BDV59DRAFT_199839 [Aspergillus ambiguus]|uniref:uncharacterized protein n=1 Tax=Aspergillus ambiguus TaxID=176160 RepID=UPI003CCD757E
MAPGDEYSVGGGGKLKLKGSKVSDGRVEKKKKKSKKNKEESQPPATATSTSTPGEESAVSTPVVDEKQDRTEPEGSPAGDVVAGKTEAERKHEEARRKRLQERLKRDGVKTHKERVEELNKYLSRLSEHHDMPKIGPG